MIQRVPVTKNFDINYSKEAIFNAITHIVNVSTGSYQSLKINKPFGLINFLVANGLNGFSVSMALTGNEENKCHIEVTLAPIYGSKVSDPGMLSKILNFFTLLEKQLSGTNISTAAVNKVTGGCMIYILLGIGISIIYLLLNL